jgi:hypothetical protein
MHQSLFTPMAGRAPPFLCIKSKRVDAQLKARAPNALRGHDLAAGLN